MTHADIDVRYLNPDIEKLTYIDDKSDWIDLRAAKEMKLKKGDFALIPLGIAMKIPYGFEAYVAPRSSTFKKWGLIQTNSIGIIDNSYCGNDDEWMMPVYATRDTEIQMTVSVSSALLRISHELYSMKRNS